MLDVFNSGDHNCSSNFAHALAAETRDRGERRMTPESADGLPGPGHYVLASFGIKRKLKYREDHYLLEW